MVLGDVLRIAGAVPPKLSQQRETEEIRQGVSESRFRDNRKHASVGGVDALPLRLRRPLLVLRIAFGELCAGKEFPVLLHAGDDADLIAVLQIRADASQGHPYLDAMPFQ